MSADSATAPRAATVERFLAAEDPLVFVEPRLGAAFDLDPPALLDRALLDRALLDLVLLDLALLDPVAPGRADVAALLAARVLLPDPLLPDPVVEPARERVPPPVRAEAAWVRDEVERDRPADAREPVLAFEAMPTA